MEDLENKLNPPPKIYRVSPLSKKCFFFLLLISIGSYAYMVIDKRLIIRNYIYAQAINAIKVDNEPLDDFMLINNFKGQWILLNLWATSCKTCIMEIPVLEILESKMKGKLLLVTIAMDEEEEQVKEFLKNNPTSLQVFFDHEKKAMKRFMVKSFPQTFLINPKNEIVAKFIGPRTWNSHFFISYLNNFIKS